MGIFFLIAPFPARCLLVPFYNYTKPFSNILIITIGYRYNTHLHIFQMPRPHCPLYNYRKFERLYLSLGTVSLTLCGFYFVQNLSLTGTVVPITEIQTYSLLWLEISKSTNRISMRFHMLKVPRYFFLLGVFYYLKNVGI